MGSMPECDKFPGRLGQICRGEVLGLSACNAYRAKWGLPPLDAWPLSKPSRGLGGGARPGIGKKDQSSGGPGTELATVFEELQAELRGLGLDVTVPAVCTCERLRAEMDSLGPDGCREHRERLVVAIGDNVWKMTISESTRNLILDAVPRLLDEALSRAAAKANQHSRTKASRKPCGTCRGAKSSVRQKSQTAVKRVTHRKLGAPMQPQWPGPRPLEPVNWTSEAEHAAISRMFAPNMRRGVWRGGVLQIWVTRACDKACFGCTQGSNLAGRPGMITLEQFDAALCSLRGYPGVVGMFGGNPCLHPQFEELCQILRARVPFEQRGLWCNNLLGRGMIARITFNPAVSNLNVHLDKAAYDEFAAAWPEAVPYLKGLEQDSRHSPPFVALQDLIPDPNRRWELIGDCDINRNWSAIICVLRGELRGFFCEIAGAQAMLHETNPNWMDSGQPMPDTGTRIEPGWWDRPMTAFLEQARLHCHACGIPLRGYGGLAGSGDAEHYSETHASIVRPKRAGVGVHLVTSEVGQGVPQVTDYIENGAL